MLFNEHSSRLGFCFGPGVPGAADVSMGTVPGPPHKDRTPVRGSGRAPELGRGYPLGKGKKCLYLRLGGGLFGKLAPMVMAPNASSEGCSRAAKIFSVIGVGVIFVTKLGLECFLVASYICINLFQC